MEKEKINLNFQQRFQVHKCKHCFMKYVVLTVMDWLEPTEWGDLDPTYCPNCGEEYEEQ